MQNNTTSDYIKNILINSQTPQFSGEPIRPSFQGVRNAFIPQEQLIPMQTAQPIQQPTGQATPEVMAAIAQPQVVSEAEKARLKNSMTTLRPVDIQGHPILSDVLNLPANALHDIKEIGTGATAMLTHPIANVYNPLKDYYTGMAYDGSNWYERAGRGARDMYNLMFGDVTKLTSENIGKIAENVIKGDFKNAEKEAKRVGGEVYRKFMDDPFIFASVAAPKPTSALIGKTAGAIGNIAEKAGVPIGEVTRNVANAFEATKTKFAATQAGVNEASKIVRKASNKDLETVLRNTREGDLRVPLTESQKALKKAVKESQLEYEKLIDDNALVSKREMAALQYVADTTGKTFQQAKRELTPTLEALTEGVDDQVLRFKNRYDDFNAELNKVNKEAKVKLDLKNEKKISDLTGDELALFKKHFTDAELAGLLETDATVGEGIQFLRDITRDALTGENYITRAAENIKYQENLGKLAQLASETNDPMITRLYEGMKLADKGEIFPTTLAGADIPVGQTVSNIGRRFQGKSSSREFGTATPEAQAKAWKENLPGYVDDIVRQRVENEIANHITQGTIDGETPLVTPTTKLQDTRYLNPETVQNGSLLEAVNNASTTAVDGWIPIDKTFVTALKENLSIPRSELAGTLGDMFRLAKQSMLSSGNYLGGNVISGAYGTLINETGLTGAVNDFVKSIGAKGRLAKQFGAYRDINLDTRKFSTRLAQAINVLNQLAGGRPIRAIDAAFQNLFAEMNSNRILRQHGVNSIGQLSKMKLGEAIRDLKLSSMMPTKFHIIPSKVQGVAGIFQPFINWVDTSAQVTYDIYRRHPYIAGMAAADLFGEVGINKELQNRLGLRVKSDKEFVSYKFDPKTGQTKEVSIDFLPQMTAIKLLQHPKELVRSGVPVISPIVNAFQGKNAFGTLMKRTHEYGMNPTTIYQNRRYKPNPKTGQLELVEGGYGDEILSTFLKEVSGVPSLVNRTAGPIAASLASQISGKDIKFYQPYGQSVFGSFSTYQPDTVQAMFSSGNPASPRTLKDVLRGLGTYYEREYYPSEDTITGRTMKALRRQGARQNRREYQRYIQNLGD